MSKKYVLFFLLLVGCNNGNIANSQRQPKSAKDTITEGSWSRVVAATPIERQRPDTAIRQYVSYKSGEYTLHTRIGIVIEYRIVSGIFNAEPDYSSIISGSFDYIKANKKSEYDKAAFFVKNQKAIADSIQILADYPINSLNKSEK